MEMQSKQDFKYATLFQSQTGEFCTDGSLPDLVMGPQTAKRYEENDGCAVTVCCITYKHEAYIRQALDSFLMQKTNFKFKVFVGEDHGPDNTAGIIREYAEKYPDIIIPFIRETNMGAQNNLIDLCNHANSPYIAFCEGDDYWIDEYKLQKQYDYMQAHSNVRMCFSRTRIDAPVDWHLRSYYRADKNGEMIMPEAIPGFKMPNRLLRADDLIASIPLHTSTHFYRWNYDLEPPEWFYKGVEGAFPLLMMQMGLGQAGFLPDVMSVYRRSDVGVLMNSNTAAHFLKTRMDYIRFLSDLRSYFIENYNGYCSLQFENRIKQEGYNYLSNAVKVADDKAIRTFVTNYPEAFRISLGAYLSFYNDSRAMVRVCSWEGYKLIVRKKCYRIGLKPYAFLVKVVDRCVRAVKAICRRVKKLFSPIHFWRYTLVPKQKNLWVVTSFRGRGYLDNTKYFYEYVCENHPEIDIRWLTNNKQVYMALKSKNMPVCLAGTKEYKKVLSHAQIAVTDHFAVSDYSPSLGYNNKTKVVQLWHGVGFKSMGDASGVKNTGERGVRYSNDILAVKGDGFFKRIGKKIKYFFIAPFRERFEKYFLFVCPGQERIDMIADIWHIPHENCLMAGHPRDLPMYSAKRQETPVKIMYAPTYRFNYARETAMVQEFLDAAPAVQKLMEKINGVFYLRMHPHTWRNYSGMIKGTLSLYDRIKLHEEKDVYQELGTFSILISDYSSIALDFALLDRPVIFHGADYQWFIQNEAGFNLDFPNVIPGPMTFNWQETLQQVEEYYNNPDKDAALREEKLKYFFDKSVNGPDNSERIVTEIKRRLGLTD